MSSRFSRIGIMTFDPTLIIARTSPSFRDAAARSQASSGIWLRLSTIRSRYHGSIPKSKQGNRASPLESAER